MSRRTPPFNALYAFTITAKHLNFTHAAKALSVTQGAVSRQISTLEEFLGFPVFHRHARGLSLTPQGKQLLPDIQHAFEQLLIATENPPPNDDILQLKIPTCAMRWMVPKLIRLHKEKPHIQIALTTSDTHEVNFKTEHFDIGVVFSASSPDRTNAYKLFDEEITPVLATHLYAQYDDFMAKFTHGTWTLLHPTPNQTDWTLWLKENHITPPHPAKHQYFNTMELAVSAATQGFGVTIADIHVVMEDIRLGRLIRPFQQTVKTGASYYLVTRPDPPRSSMRNEFIDWLKQQESLSLTSH